MPAPMRSAVSMRDLTLDEMHARPRAALYIG
jgi:hypothetical protein